MNLLQLMLIIKVFLSKRVRSLIKAKKIAEMGMSETDSPNFVWGVRRKALGPSSLLTKP